MSEPYTANDLLNAIAVASKTLSERKDEINRLNVFPVPDGDTGTNMSLTLETVVENLAHLPIGAEGADIRKAITTGALMGARGNSGVITSQILRGLCEGSVGHDELNAESIDAAFAKSQEVAFQAVRKPVEGTILTVLRDSAAAAKFARKKKLGTDEALAHVVEEAYASVQRTPDLLPVLKENGVVDAGGFGLAIFFDAFASALMGKEGPMVDELAFARGTAPKVEIEQINDWEGSAYRYCTEFLVHSDTVDEEAAKEFLPTMGDCDLMVGMHPNSRCTCTRTAPTRCSVGSSRTTRRSPRCTSTTCSSRARRAPTRWPPSRRRVLSRSDSWPWPRARATRRSSRASAWTWWSSGGQTIEPLDEDLLDAAGEVNADAVIILPNNKNIIMAAQTACDLAEFPCAVVPTKSVPEAFAALFGFDEDASLEENVESMTEAYDEVKTGEVTTAIKDSKDAHDNPIKEGDVIGIADGAIEAVGSSTEDVVMSLLDTMDAADADTLTILAGEDLDEDAFNALIERIEGAYDDLEIDAHRGDQPLYPVVMSVE